ncbi:MULTISPECIES: C39 family peptidase [unclassified Microcoleus]|uniref:C39 family peptidase n=1 Tax=unclassified Microcoleus TaxID=2642155 RepID=UPI001D965B51|nr:MULTISPECIES: C39 family peptidase [unclassified Microcoleus]MCC3418256.1 C39 family peptidase [Microcoleus sp. PH2017_07_MST_O_A]MCC3510307.1 C39 family peptidase [Microcoleus sp. PH2017_17_BER_D_A]TAE68774.1 MAG: peptidoglycan-binding protein [Oscillatoriales cyanobacterium]MCC3412116.1 C39 family peptidase [Microcoleus sp. PH2017_02_FOX_O_A]MCC3453751.1 C39 family peptidase [Microcoleus sp. PH2017_08_TRC_O_A]
MKLQNFLKSKIRYDSRAIAADDELSRQIQSRLIDLGLLKPPVDGIFGPLSTAALHRFQTLMKCGEPGFLGAITAQKLIETKPADIPKPRPILKILKDTIFKSKPLASSQLQEAEKQVIPAGKEFELLAFAPIRGHIRVALRNESFKGSGIWYVYGGHAQVTLDGVLLYPKPNPPTVRLGIPYRSQMDNLYNPTGSCNVTSIAMCLDFLRVPRRQKTGQYEDELYQYAIDKGYSRWEPRDLAKIVRDYGAQDYFTENATIDDVQDWLASGNPAVIHGYFTSFGHIIVAAGYDSEGFFVHDPYGEWFPTGYDTTVSGSYLHYSYRLIRSVCMADGNFWVHFISK